MRRVLLFGLFCAALAIGAVFGWVDARPGWDDTGILAGAILIASACFGAIRPRWAWLWALAIGGWVPVLNILRSGNYGAVLALVVALVGAYAGALARWFLFPPRATPEH